jgi:magnesium chelatase family protein
MAMTAAQNGFSGMVVPLENAREAAVVQNVEVFGVASMVQAVGFLSGQLPLETTTIDIDKVFNIAATYDMDFSDVKGQESVKRALIIAAAGAHNIMMIGPPGAGKTMLAQRMATILPPLTLEESLETTRVYSSVGLLEKNTALIATRPVRAPHHTASGPALVGGGTVPRPGELSLAHHGILFLDEFAEFPRHILEMIRQPLEDGTVTVSRAKGTIIFPARFILIAAMKRYISRVSGPLLDRIDIHIDVPPVGFGTLRGKSSRKDSDMIRQQVVKARQIQTERFGAGKLITNAIMTHKQVEKFCPLDEPCEQLLKQAMIEFGLSARAHDKICKVARTIADLDNSSDIQPEYIAEAISYRKLDRKL